MNPVLLATGFGLLKGLAVRSPVAQKGRPNLALHFAGPITEEVIYRALPRMVAGNAHRPALASAIFARDHLAGLSGPSALVRFADAFLGGLLYEEAYRRHGFAGAALAHCLHNIGCTIGRGG